jgi:hypothetical protein
LHDDLSYESLYWHMESCYSPKCNQCNQTYSSTQTMMCDFMIHVILFKSKVFYILKEC